MRGMTGTRRVVLATVCMVLGYCAPGLEPVTDVVMDGGEDGAAADDCVAWDDGRIADAEAEVPPGLTCEVQEHTFAASDAETCGDLPENRGDPSWTPDLTRCARLNFPGIGSDDWPYVQGMMRDPAGTTRYYLSMGFLRLEGDDVWVVTMALDGSGVTVRYCH